MSNEITVGNGVKGTGALCEGVSPGRCPVAQRHRPGRHQYTAGDKREKGRQQDNEIVMKCYFRSEPKRRGYRKRMIEICSSKDMFEVTEQRVDRPI